LRVFAGHFPGPFSQGGLGSHILASGPWPCPAWRAGVWVAVYHPGPGKCVGAVLGVTDGGDGHPEDCAEAMPRDLHVTSRVYTLTGRAARRCRVGDLETGPPGARRTGYPTHASAARPRAGSTGRSHKPRRMHGRRDRFGGSRRAGRIASPRRVERRPLSAQPLDHAPDLTDIQRAALRWCEDNPLGEVTPAQQAIGSTLVGKLLR